MLKVFDMAANKGSNFTTDSFRSAGFLENSDLILITNITESNIGSAAKIAESASASQTVTAGILSGNVDTMNQNMKKFLDSADAVILSRVKNEETARRITEGISDLITKSGFVNLDIEDITAILKNAGTVHFGTGTAKDSRLAAQEALKMSGDISGAKGILLNITAGMEIALGELLEASLFIEEMNTTTDAQVIWGHVIDDDMGENVRVSIFAAMNDKGKL